MVNVSVSVEVEDVEVDVDIENVWDNADLEERLSLLEHLKDCGLDDLIDDIKQQIKWVEGPVIQYEKELIDGSNKYMSKEQIQERIGDYKKQIAELNEQIAFIEKIKQI